ncbi:uncharacterized protein LOC119557352 [Drosophila subpulchrella]|uniref:uncharacterized protein LOC119557352 n=1 Tax=Drosophila subpulchrella TaxID=1486046 RepID=UPI0018A1B131|nr:uncharacterized protein LOC119557352 [Drosophila subpulchrella]
MPVTYKTRTLPRQRNLVPNLLRSILHALEDAHRPMSDTELILVLGVQYRRNDPEFQRQVQINLRDGVEYGILKRQRNHFSVRSRRLSELMATLGTPSSHH